MTATTKTKYLPARSDDEVIHLPPAGGMEASEHVLDPRSRYALNAALATRRPLLVRGEPGNGKSQLARAAAGALGRAFLHHAVDGRTEPRDLLWTVDAVARLAEAQILGATRGVNRTAARQRVNILEFVHPGVLWWALDWGSAAAQARRAGVGAPVTPDGWRPSDGVVLLVDEVDKADAAVPNALLDALGHGRFDVPGRGPVSATAEVSPLMVFTTNEERTLPDAFLRRCMVLQLDLPRDRAELVAHLVARGRAHFQKVDEGVHVADAVLTEVAEAVADDREKLAREDVLRPGVAEYVDLLRALHEQRPGDAKGQAALLAHIREFALDKHVRERRA